MPRIHVFADESGNFDFSRGTGASRFFILTTVTFFDDRSACADLQTLRYELAWNGIDHPGPFHATEDAQVVRDAVFAALSPHAFRIDATVLEKSKAQPQLHTTNQQFYQYAWYYHMKNVAPLIATSTDELFVVAASVGTKARRASFHNAVTGCIQQVSPTTKHHAASWSAASDTGLQIADYCCWALARKWERGDPRPYDLIKTKVTREYDLFSRGTVHYY